MTTGTIREQFDEQGFVLVRGLFTQEQIADWRERALSLCSGCDGEQPPGELATHGFEDILLNEDILGAVKQVLGNDLIYFGDSSLHCSPNDRTFHVDARGDLDDPSCTDYGVVRCGIYLQDHTDHSGGLKVRVGSHKRALLRPGTIKRVLKRKARPATLLHTPARNLKTRTGDFIFWSLRTHHSGGAVILKGLRRLAFPPRFDALIPTFLRLPDHENRLALFFAYGAPGEQTERYIRDQVGRRPEAWEASTFGTLLSSDRAQKLGLSIRTDGVDAHRSVPRSDSRSL
jgi:hypothetical protein